MQARGMGGPMPGCALLRQFSVPFFKAPTPEAVMVNEVTNRPLTKGLA